MQLYTKPHSSISRRDFVFGTAAAGAAMAGLSPARSAHAAGSDVIRVGLIGCGGRGTGAAAEAMQADPGVRLVAMGDVFASRVDTRRKALEARLPDQMMVDDDHCFVGLDAYQKVIEASDVVLIANAAKFQPTQLAAAIEAGKHVFVEKPHAIDPAGIRKAARACELAKQKKLGVLSGLQSRFNAGIRETMRRIHDGQIGDIVAVEENYLRGPYGNTTRPGDMRELEIQYGNQYRFSWLCGDDVPQSLVHNLDRATWALGETPPVSCYGLGGRSGAQNLLGDVFDLPFGGVSIRQRRSRVRPLPHGAELLRPGHQHGAGHQGRCAAHGGPDNRGKPLAVRGRRPQRYPDGAQRVLQVDPRR
ncbi:MAG: Gfo/Idh/MocA family oxidoreductase [Thermoguttaceae bacterium]|jgi:predicted dehydrogenase|nr:Gfo/Idh/MocA family oxidoreductase [Thermoguttaceae bacterium]